MSSPAFMSVQTALALAVSIFVTAREVLAAFVTFGENVNFILISAVAVRPRAVNKDSSRRELRAFAPGIHRDRALQPNVHPPT